MNVGEKVECRYGRGSQFFPGRVESIGSDGTFEIVYDDGDKESGVVRRRLKQAGERQIFKLSVDEAVDAKCSSQNDEVMPGRVVRIDGENVYEVEFESGKRETMERKYIFAMHSSGIGNGASAVKANNADESRKGAESGSGDMNVCLLYTSDAADE